MAELLLIDYHYTATSCLALTGRTAKDKLANTFGWDALTCIQANVEKTYYKSSAEIGLEIELK